ncbi:MAG: bifunctional phosphoribosylaminoimidazolecarboxamide formyltransferase/IMP cyclohydrolase [Actinobacteria bacterium]|nr:bifunctional phosphoribosylaminoimidazolecarboxamide formyltransferase/IMP cyclohydrolase [Actinomycetota bacterium]
MTEEIAVHRAIVSVADKAGLVAFGNALAEMDIEIVSTGSTAGLLAEAGIPVTPVADVTGFPEMLDGRVKTLHPAIHAGVLADKRDAAHLEQLAGQGLETFDLVVVSLYLGVVVRPERYESVIAEIRREGGLSRETRMDLAREAFEEIAAYDAAIAGWFTASAAGEEQGSLPETLTVSYVKVGDLRYGENPHQRGALYRQELAEGLVGGARVLQGKEMSFNNWLDAESAWSLAADLAAPAVAIIKHHNPCGAAEAGDLVTAYRAAQSSDPVSAFGGVVGVSDPVDVETARAITEIFTEVVIAPGYSPEALEVLAQKENLRVVEAPPPAGHDLEVRPVAGGALVQDRDAPGEDPAEFKVMTSREPTEAEWADLRFAWTVAARVTSNAIVLASDRATVGVGAGQMSRVDSVDIAARKAGERSRGSVLASDAFFPFRDGIDRAGEAGVAAVVQPGGSVRDDEVVAAAEEHGMTMVFTGRRHFRH